MSFDEAGDSTKIDITLEAGEVCFYTVHAECGIPAFEPSSTDNVTIYSIDYDDDEVSEDKSSTSYSSGDDGGFVMP